MKTNWKTLYVFILLYQISFCIMAETQDSALLPSPIIFNPGEAYQFNNRKWQGCPSIEKTKNGRVWATWYSGDTGEGPASGPDNWSILICSDDDGKTWSNPILVVDPLGKIGSFNPCLWVDPNDTLWLFWSQTYNQWDGRAGVWVMKCENSDSINCWSVPKRICDGVMINKPTLLQNDSILLPVAIWNVPINDKVPEEYKHRMPTGSYIYVTDKIGNKLDLLNFVAIPNRTVDEPMIIEKKDKVLWLLVRTSYGIGESYSFDKGRTWTAGSPSILTNADSRFHITRLKSGNILLIHHSPPIGILTRNYLTASLSQDDGLTWPYNLLIDNRYGISYPDVTQDENGKIYLIYDYDRTGEKAIYYCSFYETDIVTSNHFSSIRIIEKIMNDSIETVKADFFIKKSNHFLIIQTFTDFDKLEIISLQGQVLLSLSNKTKINNVPISTLGFQSGIYLIKLIKKGKAITCKILL